MATCAVREAVGTNRGSVGTIRRSSQSGCLPIASTAAQVWRPGRSLSRAEHHKFEIANCPSVRALVWQPHRFSVVLSEDHRVTLNIVTLRLKVASPSESIGSHVFNSCTVLQKAPPPAIFLERCKKQRKKKRKREGGGGFIASMVCLPRFFLNHPAIPGKRDVTPSLLNLREIRPNSKPQTDMICPNPAVLATTTQPNAHGKACGKAVLSGRCAWQDLV